MADREVEKQQAIQHLRTIAPIGSTLYTVLKAVSSNKMRRCISVYVIVDNKPVWLDRYIERLGYYKYDRDAEGLIVKGTGMDMGFELVYASSYEVWKGEIDRDSGCAWNQEWL